MKETNMGDFKQGSPKEGLTLKTNKVRLKRTQRWNLTHTSRNSRNFSPQKNFLAAFLESKLFAKNLQEGVKNEPLVKTKDLCIQNFINLTKKKHCEYSEATLLVKSIKYIKLKMGMGRISCPKDNSRKVLWSNENIKT